ncbi:MAG: ATP-binding protein [Bacteroidales bacterium]|jgi:AAA15 family ATPase/GTPase|nr:ATP-binding protein [Bacteroidales bacterium]MDY0174443.1 ATP-binding protein [Bacteroidales bacterium]HHU98134.1 ATP-binding protein [Petrimonas sp.]
MLLQFSVKNYKTFKNKATLSLIASNYDKGTKETENVTYQEQFNLRILKSAVIYGANASGKTKLIEAFMFWKDFIINSSKGSQEGEKIEITPFLLDENSAKEPTEFEAIFICNKKIYRYGFEVTSKKIVSEWLYYRPKTKEIELFYREGEDFEPHERDFIKGAKIVREGFLRDNALLLSTAAQFNDEKSIEVLQWVRSIAIISKITDSNPKGFTAIKIASRTHKPKILELLRAADLGIEDVVRLESETDTVSTSKKQKLLNFLLTIPEIQTSHKKYNEKKIAVDKVSFNLDKEESAGTQKFFALAGPIIDVLEKGHVFIVDELDAQLHPNLVSELILMFNSKEFNPFNAQLIFNTHNTNLLNATLFRRDQIWFTEKNRYGEVKLYSLADFKSTEVRKNEAYGFNYMKGKYGAVPHLDFSEHLNTVLFEGDYEE